MTKLKLLLFAVGGLMLVAGAAAIHYFLPRGEVVNLTGSEIMRFDNGRDGGSVATATDGVAFTRDVRLIYARTPDGRSVRTYRNEDVEIYAKFDSGSLNSEVQSILLDQSKGDLVPVLALSYGWRIEFFSMYPNMISLQRVSPDYVYWPWHAAMFVALFGALICGVLWLVLRAARAARRAAFAAAELAVQTVETAGVEIAEKASTWASRSVPVEKPQPPRRPPPNVSSER